MKHNAKKTLALLLALVMVLSLVPAMGTAAYADGTTYTITIPSSLTVTKSGWNATDGISATGTLADGKKLTVTASSANSWALKQQDGSETVGYTMKETSDGEAKTAWEFTTLPGSATLGIDVADYSTKPAGTYQDTVTFTVKVEDAAVVKTLTIKKGNSIADSDTTIEYYEGDTWADAVTRNPDKIAIDANTSPLRIVLPGKTGDEIDLCKDEADRYHLVLPTHTIVADGNYLWW